MMIKATDEKCEVGNDILSYCGKCKADATHIISVTDNGKLSKVKCRTCGAQHNYRKPKSLIKEKAAGKPVKKAKSTLARKSQKNPSQKWEALLADYDLNKDIPEYSMKKNFKESSLIRHVSFGIGVIIKKIDQGKIEVQFEEGLKLLVNNRT